MKKFILGILTGIALSTAGFIPILNIARTDI